MKETRIALLCPYCNSELLDFDSKWTENGKVYNMEVARCKKCDRDIPKEDAIKTRVNI